MHRRVLVGIAVAIVLLGGVGIALFDAPSNPETGTDQSSLNPQLELAQVEQANETQFRVNVSENGDARWTVEYRQRITNETKIEQFKQFADRFNTEQTETFTSFQSRATRLTDDGARITSRNMNATAFRRNARYSEISRDGIIEMSFRWVGFAETSDGQVIVSDVFDGGFVILDDQQLRIEHGPNLAFDSVSPDPDQVEGPDQSALGEWVEWNGYREFAAGAIDVRLSPPDVNPDPPGDSQGTDSDADGPNGDDSSNSNANGTGIIPIVLALVILLGIAALAVWYTVGRSSDDDGPAADSPAGADAGPAQPEVKSEQLLSDEDRVLKLLEENGGRMRQVTIVEETEWSKSKVSMLLSEMEDEDEISKLRVGRENIISLSGEEPEAAGSPFDEEG